MVLPRVWRCILVCALVSTVCATHEASGQGESNYDEEYDDEGPYRRPYELPDTDDEGLEDFDEHAPVVDAPLDPITDDDISYSGYYDEEGLDGLTSASSVPGRSVSSVPHVSVSDDARGEATGGVRVSVASVAETTVIPKSIGTVGTTVHSLTTIGVNGTAIDVVDDATVTTEIAENANTCAGHQKLAEQPVYAGPSVNFIRKCCPHGQRLVHERSIVVSCRKESLIALGEQAAPEAHAGRPNGTTPMGAIKAQFYDGCIEDLEEDISLGYAFGNPCSSERGLVSFGARTNDTLYVLQNGSLLVVYGNVHDYDVFDTYCLDYDAGDGSLLGYVCPIEVRVRPDIISGQLFVLNVSLLFAIPLLLITAALYMIVPALHDMHGRALAMNCVNFAIALVLESYFQHRRHDKRANSEEMVLAGYAEYFILATFFWLLVNCVNNCFHAWFYAPRDKELDRVLENLRFIGYAALAQLLPLWIVVTFSTTEQGNPAIKYYFFHTIMVVLLLIPVSLFICFAGLRRMKQQWCEKQQNLHESGRTFSATENGHNIPPAAPFLANSAVINKVIYMTNYTTALYVVMASVWTVMTVTYLKTYELPIFYDILFSLQGILMFLIFVCMRTPFRIVRKWMKENRYCSSNEQLAAEASVPLMPMGRQISAVESVQSSEVTPKPPIMMARQISAFESVQSSDEAGTPARRMARHLSAVEPVQSSDETGTPARTMARHFSAVEPVQSSDKTAKPVEATQPAVDKWKLTKLRLNNPFMYLPE